MLPLSLRCLLQQKLLYSSVRQIKSQQLVDMDIPMVLAGTVTNQIVNKKTPVLITSTGVFFSNIYEACEITGMPR